jgi:hypothetical protein
MSARKLSALERTFVSALTMLSELSEGYSIEFLDELVRQHGISGFFKWAQATNRCWMTLVDRYGEADAHLLAFYASMGNGCHYCAHGHLLAHNLQYFEERTELYPIDEAEVETMMMERDPALLDVFRKRLSAPHHQKALKLMERIHALRSGGPLVADEEDPYLRQAIALYEWVNECSIVAVGLSPPLGAIAKKKVLRSRYAQARARQRESAIPATTATTG